MRRPLDARASLLVLALCVVWGSQQVILKSVSTDIAPVMQLALRFGCASIFFGIWVIASEGRNAFSDGTLKSGLILGLLFSLEFILMGAALNYTTAAHSVVFLYTAPIFTALGLQYLPEERLSASQWVGIAIAFFGIVVAFLSASGRSIQEILAGDLAALCSGICWGLSNVALRRGRVSKAGTAKTILYQVGTATILLSMYATLTHQTHLIFSATAIASLAFQTLIIAIASYILWFRLLQRYLTSRLMLLSLLTPIFGVLMGVGLLGDPMTIRFMTGALLVFSGVLMVNLKQIVDGLRNTP